MRKRGRETAVGSTEDEENVEINIAMLRSCQSKAGKKIIRKKSEGLRKTGKEEGTSGSSGKYQG